MSVRLRRPGEFEAVLKGGRRLHEQLLTAVIKPNSESFARLGFAISARTVPRAVDRNRIKRQARESFRMNRRDFPAIDIVILARPGAGQATAPRLRSTLETFWKRLTATCTSSREKS